jgi:hypothetical protein
MESCAQELESRIEDLEQAVREVAEGLISAADKAKLDSIEEYANNYTHPDSHPPSIITQDAQNRFMTDEEREKLAGLEAELESLKVDYSLQEQSTGRKWINGNTIYQRTFQVTGGPFPANTVTSIPIISNAGLNYVSNIIHYNPLKLISGGQPWVDIYFTSSGGNYCLNIFSPLEWASTLTAYVTIWYAK